LSNVDCFSSEDIHIL